MRAGRCLIPHFEGEKTFLGLVPAPGISLGAALSLGDLSTMGMRLGLFYCNGSCCREGNKEKLSNLEEQSSLQTPNTHCRPWVPIPAPGCPSQTRTALGDINGRNTSKLILKGVQRGLCTPSTAPPRSFSSGTACSYYNKHLSRNLALICILAALILMKYANVCKMKFIS